MKKIEKLKKLLLEKVKKAIVEARLLSGTPIQWSAKKVKLPNGKTIEKNAYGKIVAWDSCDKKVDRYVISINTNDGEPIRAFATTKDFKVCDPDYMRKSVDQIVREKITDLEMKVVTGKKK